MCGETAAAMEKHVLPFTTPIGESLPSNKEEGILAGSGSYVQFEGRKYLFTNQHVADKRRTRVLSHKFKDDDPYLELTNDFEEELPPIDLAITHIKDTVWNRALHGSVAIPISRFAEKHVSVPRELIFLVGTTEERSGFVFGTLKTSYTPLLSQEMPDTTSSGPDHFHVHYNTEKARTVNGTSGVLPVPKGLSGSFVWNTKRIECDMKGIPWSPELAVVTGILCTWVTKETYVVGTRVEHMRAFLEGKAK